MKRIKIGLSILTLSLICSCVMVVFVASGSVTSLLVRWTAEQHAQYERADETAELEHQLEIQRERDLAEAKTARAKSWITVQVALMGLGVMVVGAVVIGVWRLALGRVRSMREGWAVAHARASRQDVPQSLTWSPRTQHTIKDVSTESLAQLPVSSGPSGDLASQITSTLTALGLAASAKQLAVGPQVITFGITPGQTEKGKLTTVSQIRTRADDLAVALSVASVRISPAPGYIAVEVPRQDREMVELGDLLASKVWQNTKAHLPLALGKDTQGQWVVGDLAKLPHLLVAGATGGGKSVAVNSMLVGLMSKYTPQELKLLLVDPAQVEFVPYANNPHLSQPVVTDPTKALPALESAINEMEARCTLMAKVGRKEIVGYNKIAQTKLPWLVIIIDELADLMMVAEKEVEAAIVRLGQKARKAGIHLVLSTQRPSSDVVTGLIKANLPGRMSLAVTDGTNSEIILDERGAEMLLGMGDGLFKSKSVKTTRIQAPFISDEELAKFLAQPAAPQPRLTQSPQLPAISPVSPPVAPEVAPVSSRLTAENSGEQRATAGENSDSGGGSAIAVGGGSAKAICFSIWDVNEGASYESVMEVAGISEDKRSTARSYKRAWKIARGLS